MRTLIAFAAIAIAACHSPVRISPPFDASTAGPASDEACAKACAVLDAASCSVPNCTATCIQDQALGTASQLDPGCVIVAGTNRSALVACGACQ